MALALVASEILESILTRKSPAKPTDSLQQDGLTVSIDRMQDSGRDADSLFIIKYSVIGPWTREVAAKNFTDYSPSLPTLIQERQAQSEPPPNIQWTLVTESYQDIHTLLVDYDGCLNISQERVPASPDDPQQAVHITLKCNGHTTELDEWSSCVKAFMYKFKLLQPSMMLLFTSSSGDCKDFSLGQEKFRSSTINNIQMITDCHYFMKFTSLC